MMDSYWNSKHFKIVSQSKFIIFLVLIIILPMKEVCCQTMVSSVTSYDLNYGDNSVDKIERDYFIGPCLVNANNICPDGEVTFHLYTRRSPTDGREIFINDTYSNLKNIGFDPKLPTKIVIHGYNSNMLLYSMVGIKTEYLKKIECNVIAINWDRYASAPCYPVAVYNARHVGKCLAQLIKRLREMLAQDIHVLGFSLGAHVPAFAANELRPYKISRITGLDPAMPLFMTVNKDEKLSDDDAEFVDVIHTNAFVQGKVEACGHIDFYMNGGINQPGCRGRNPFGCDHHRAPEYFAESINSKIGFWGWPCTGFIDYLIGYCPPKLPAVLAGDDVDRTHRGFYLVTTNSASPFANGTSIFDEYRRGYEKKVGSRKKYKHVNI